MLTEDSVGIAELVPSALLLDGAGPATLPATNLASFVQRAFLDPGSPLFNVDHDHLGVARIGYLFTNIMATRKGKEIMGQAEMPSLGNVSKWAKARAAQQIEEWFGEEQDFIITLYAPYVTMVTPVYQLALLEHELYHCGQLKDEYGVPKFKRDGTPVFTMRGHDVEEFVGIARRYGIGAGESRAFAEAILLNRPELGPVSVSTVCASCLR